MEEMLIAVFGTSKVEELALPMFGALAAVTAGIFWLVLTISRRRQNRLIAGYNDKLTAHSKQLRRNGDSFRKHK